MSEQIDPRKYGLPSRTVLEKIDDKTLAIVIDRQSRIIMADGQKISDKVDTVRCINPDLKVIIRTTAPVCSKTRSFLEGKGIDVKEIDTSR